jgi:hypothetical protein
MASKTNVTLKLDTALVRKIKVVAAQQNTSISQLMTDQLEKLLESKNSYERSKQRALKLMEEGLDLNWTPPKSRDELHER